MQGSSTPAEASSDYQAHDTGAAAAPEGDLMVSPMPGTTTTTTTTTTTGEGDAEYQQYQEEPGDAIETTEPKSHDDIYFRDNLSFDATFEQVFHVFRERYLVFIGIAFLMYVTGWIVALIAAYLLGADLQIDGFSVSANMRFVDVGYYDENGDFQAEANAAVWQKCLYFFECAIYYCFLCIAHAASVWLAAHLYLEQRPNWMDAFRQAIKNAWPLIMSLVIVGCFFVLPMLLVVLVIAMVPALLPLAALMIVAYGMFLQVLFYHTYPAIMVEKVGSPVDALKRSYYLTQDHRFHIFGVLVCWGLIRNVIGFVIGYIASAGYTNRFFWILANTLDTGFGILFAAIESVFQAVLYLRSRIIKEQMDRVTLAADLGSDVLSGDEDQNYVVMGSIDNNDNDTGAEQDQNVDNDKDTANVGVMA